MILSVTVKVGKNEDKVWRHEDVWEVWVTARPQNNQANAAVISVLADYFSCSKSNIRIKRGLTSTRKTIEVSC